MEIKIPEDAKIGNPSLYDSAKTYFAESYDKLKGEAFQIPEQYNKIISEAKASGLPANKSWILAYTLPEEKSNLIQLYKSGDTKNFETEYSRLRDQYFEKSSKQAIQDVPFSTMGVVTSKIAAQAITPKNLEKLQGASKSAYNVFKTSKTGKTVTENIPGMFSSKFKNIKNAASAFKSGFSEGSILSAEENLSEAGLTKAEQFGINLGQKYGKVRDIISSPFSKNSKVSDNTKQEVTNIFENSAQKIGNKFNKKPTIAKNPFSGTKTINVTKQLPDDILQNLAAAGLSGLFGGGEGGENKTQNGGILTPIQNFASAALTSMPSGGDSGMVGESHFGGGSLNGLTIMQALSKIYSLLIESNDALRKISDNTSRALQQSAKADTGADIASANAKARETETGQGYSAIYENNRQLNNDEVISENGESRQRETGKSGLTTKLVNALKTGVDWTVKSAALGLGMGAIAASDAQANIGGGDLFSMGESEGYSGFYSDSQYDRIKSIVRQAESKNNYSAVYQTPAGKPEKQLTDMTIREIIEFQDKMLRSAPSGTKPHSPVGAYQIVRDTLKANYELAGLTLDDKFTPENQDKIADVLISKRKYRSDGSIEDFARELGGEWEVLKSMPNKPSKVPYSVIMDAIVGVEKDQTDEKIQPQMQESNLEYIKPPTSEKFTKIPQGFSVIDDIDQAIKNNNENNLSSATGINTSKVQKDTTQHIDELEQLSSGKYSSSNKVIPQSVLYQQKEMVFDSKTGKLVAKTNTPAVTPIIDEPTTHENLKESTLGAQSIVTEKPQDHAAMQGMNDNLSKVAQLVAANQQTQPVPQIIRTPPPDPAGTGGGIMSVRNEDPVLLTLTFQNVRTA